jgi:hypothetical protein
MSAAAFYWSLVSIAALFFWANRCILCVESSYRDFKKVAHRGQL